MAARGRAVTALTLTDFRNYARARLEAPAAPVVLVGANGAGKTNVLEALSLLAPGRGLRGAGAAELTRQDAPAGRGWGVHALVSAPDQTVEIGTGLADPASAKPRRAVRLDGVAARRQQELAEALTVLWLTPSHDALFTGPAEARRRFFDRLAAAADSAHVGQLAAYDQARKQRRRLLRAAEAPGGRLDSAWVAALEAQMAAHGTAVAAARRSYLATLDAYCAEAAGPFPAARLASSGLVEGWLAQAPAVTVEEWFADALAHHRTRDAAAGTPGPHRSDVAVARRSDDRPAAGCSTGEQKALLLALVLAEARRHADAHGGAPILLLDEVAAHLDPGRRAALLERLLALDGQCWLTGTEARLFAALGARGAFRHVAEGAIWPQEPPEM